MNNMSPSNYDLQHSRTSAELDDVTYGQIPGPNNPALVVSLPFISTPQDSFPAVTPSLEKNGRFIVTKPPIRQWTPVSLRRWYAITLFILMLLVAAGLEIALHISNKQRGWGVPSSFGATTGLQHYAYTLPPVALAMIVIALWAWTDLEIKRMQPYIDLAYGNAPASRTLLLDYSNQHAALVSISAWHHRHYLVALSSLMVLTGLAIQPLAASLFTVKEEYGDAPNINVDTFEELGLNPTFSNLTAFSTAAGFVQSSVLYNVTPPNFVSGDWAIGSVEVPTDQVANGTMFANLTAVKSSGNCKAGDSGNLTPFSNGTGFTLSGTSDGCSVSIPVQTMAVSQYGVDVVTCPNSPLSDPFKPVVFWILSRPDPSVEPLFSLVYCTPAIELYNVAAQVALQSGNLLSADIIGNFSQPNNLTDPNGPMQGRVLNGVGFDLANEDFPTQQRAQALKIGLVSAIIQQAAQSPGGLSNQIQTFGMIPITRRIYELYLSLASRNNYFLPEEGTTEVKIKTFRLRLFVVSTTVHILTSVLIVFTALGATIHTLHFRMRDLVVIPRRPGTLASAAAFTARSNMGDVLDGHLDEAALTRVLENKRFRMDRNTGRIVMEGHEEFHTALLPFASRKGGDTF